MSIELHILRDLAAGRSTADSIAGRLHKPTDAVLAILRRLIVEGSVDSKPLSVLTVWHLTTAGRALAETSTKAPQPA